jgi:hypothetical protein
MTDQLTAVPAHLTLPFSMPHHPAVLAAQVREFGTPTELLQDSTSMFNRLVEDTGHVASAVLRQMAAQGPPPLAEGAGGDPRSHTQSAEVFA